MPVGTGTRGVVITLTRDPALVRTVRLVAAAVARRSGRDEEFVEEVRLAVGEACALFVEGLTDPTGEPPEQRDRRTAGAVAATDRVSVSMTFADRFEVRVATTGAVPLPRLAIEPDDLLEDLSGDLSEDGLVTPWVLLNGLVENLTIDRGRRETVLRMSWPLT